MNRIPKIMLLVFRVRCGTLKSNQPKEFECIMEFPLTHYNVFKKGLSGNREKLRGQNYVLFLGLRSQSSRSDQCFMFRDIFHSEGGN